ncbi:MAG TPA: hypothetical protein VLM85_30485 [Polyangiaceae bacterium]|nr:hypothetical protein [Polyangiaceae bacterium]
MRPHVLCAAALLATFAASARAEEEKKTTEETKEAKEAEEPRGQVNLELVVGTGQVDALNPASAPFSGQLRYERQPTDVTAAGIVLSGLYDLTPHFAVGVRLPLALAELRPEVDAKRSTANLGNVELEAELKTEASKGVELFAGLGLALPTSLGDELPSEQTLAGSQEGIDPVAADKYSVNKAVAAAYGYENNALWLAGYLGVVPLVGAKLRFGRLRIEPYAKAEMMFSVRPEAQERAIVEIDAGGRVAVSVTRWLDLGARAWGSFTVTDHEGDLNIGVIEPELRVGQEGWRVTAGVLVPFAGELASQDWISVRLSGSVLF